MTQQTGMATPGAPDKGLLFACKLDGKGGARPVGWQEIEDWKDGGGAIWIHLDRSTPGAQDWLRNRSGLTKATVEAILAEENRPRVFRGKRGYIAIIRGLNQNEGAEREDLVAVRMWCDGQRLITVRQRQLFVPRQVYTELVESGIGPADMPNLFCHLIDRLVRQFSSVVSSYEDSLDAIELEAGEEHSNVTNRQIADLRRQVIELRRFIAPQREALGHMMAEPPDWLTGDHRPAIREAADRQQRYLEELDELRERCVIAKDDMLNRLNQQMNRNMYVISIIATIFLPLSFITGLLGINVGGMPGVENTSAFWVTTGVLTILLFVEVWLIRALKWF